MVTVCVPHGCKVLIGPQPFSYPSVLFWKKLFSAAFIPSGLWSLFLPFPPLSVLSLSLPLSPLQSPSTEPQKGGSDGIMRDRQVSIEVLSSLAAHLPRIPGAHHRLHLSEGHTSPSRLTQLPGGPLSGVLVLPSSDFLLGKIKRRWDRASVTTMSGEILGLLCICQGRSQRPAPDLSVRSPFSETFVTQYTCECSDVIRKSRKTVERIPLPRPDNSLMKPHLNSLDPIFSFLFGS